MHYHVSCPKQNPPSETHQVNRCENTYMWQNFLCRKTKFTICGSFANPLAT